MAAKTIIERGEGDVAVTSIREGYRILFREKKSKKIPSYWGGIIHINPDGRVRAFEFERALSDLLFNTWDLGGDEFAQKFIENYDIPKLDPSRQGDRIPYRVYYSPDGWTLRMMQDGAFGVTKTPKRQFDK